MRLGRRPVGGGAVLLAAVLAAVVVLGLFAIFGHGLKIGGPSADGTPNPGRSPVPVTISASGDVNVTYAANGQTVTVGSGHALSITLDSTYWMFQGSSNTAVLKQAGQVETSPASCIPGGGCGTVTAHFRAMGPGRADVTASRTSCGEGLACGPDQSTYRITVVVTG